MKVIIYLFSIIFLIVSCNNNDNATQPSVDNPNITGTVYGNSAVPLNEAYNNLEGALEENGDISIIAEVDHAENASSAGMELDPTKIIYFGNPNLGTPLMQQNQLAGLDLPQKVLFYEKNNEVFALYSSSAYLESRYALQGAETLDQISGALEDLVGSAIENPVNSSDNQTVWESEGVETVESSNDFITTYANLKETISQNENLSIVAELDHQANAESVGMELRPTRIIMFGNPNLGTPLMQTSQTAGLDLPQKMLVWEDEEGVVNISYNDPDYLSGRHNISGRDTEIEQIATALENLANTAAGI